MNVSSLSQGYSEKDLRVGMADCVEVLQGVGQDKLPNAA